MTPHEVVVKVYSLARKVSKILQDNNILFWSSGGTTLGLFVKSNVHDKERLLQEYVDTLD